MQILESDISRVLHGDLIYEGEICRTIRRDIYLRRGGFPERITIVQQEVFNRAKIQISVGRSGPHHEEDYINKQDLPSEPISLVQRPDSVFLPPFKDGIVRLTVKVFGTEAPDKGMIVMFIKYRIL